MKWSESASTNHFVQGLYKMMSSAVLTHAITLCAAPILIGIYSPEMFGKFALAVSAIALLSAVSALRFERAIVLCPTNMSARTMVGICIFTNFLVVFAVFISLFMGMQLFGVLDFNNTLFGLICCTHLLISAVLQSVVSWLIRNKRFSKIAFIDCTSIILAVVLQCFFGFVGMTTASSLLACVLLGKALAAFWLLPYLHSKNDCHLHIGSNTIHLLRQYWRLPVFAAPYAVFSVLQLRSLLFIVAFISSTSASGVLAISLRFTVAPAAAVGAAIRRVFQPYFAQELHSTVTLFRVVGALLFMSMVAPIMLAFIWLANNSSHYMLPTQWIQVEEYVFPCAIFAAVLLLTSWLDTVFDVLRRQGTALAVEAISTILGLTCALIYGIIFDSSIVAVEAFSTVMVLYNFGWLFYVWRLTKWPLKPLWAVYSALLSSTLASSMLVISLRNQPVFCVTCLIGLAALLMFMRHRILKSFAFLRDTADDTKLGEFLGNKRYAA